MSRDDLARSNLSVAEVNALKEHNARLIRQAAQWRAEIDRLRASPWHPMERLAELNPSGWTILWRRQKAPGNFRVGIAYKTFSGTFRDHYDSEGFTEATEFMIIPRDEE